MMISPVPEAPQGAGGGVETALPRPTARMLDVAEQIGTLIEAGVWTAATFPISSQLERVFRARQETVRGALLVAVARGQVRRGVDPASDTRRVRYLPCPPVPSAAAGVCVEPPSSGPELVAAAVEHRIAEGVWTVEGFPTTRQIAAELGCGHDTVDAGMRIAADRGLIHKIQVVAAPPGRGRKWVWRPVAAVPERPVYDRLLAGIRSGALAGQLPFFRQMGRTLRVSPRLVAEAYRCLASEGVIRRVRVGPRPQDHQWIVIDGVDGVDGDGNDGSPAALA